jgi:hypothetical protein
MKLLFSDLRDVCDTWGKLEFDANPIRTMGSCEDPGFIISCCVPRDDGTIDVYGYRNEFDTRKIYKMEKKSKWQIFHATTRNGISFNDIEVVYESEQGPWEHYMSITYSSDRNEFLALKNKDHPGGFDIMAYFSKDGRNWQEYEGNPVYNDGDAWGVLWSSRLQRYVSTTKCFQHWRKYLPDHGKCPTGEVRRVTSVRWSMDGRHWEPSEPVLIHYGKPLLPDALMLNPDEKDPPDLEFYSTHGFSYHDRYFAMTLNYAASPLLPDKHGPQLDTEWWFSRDGLKWERPYRDVDATPDGVTRISHNPMVVDGRILFHFGNKLLGMKEDRLTSVSSRANSEFSTIQFTMPDADLYLNAAIPSSTRPSTANQAYLMAAMIDSAGRVILGFEREKCLVQAQDGISIPLNWEGRTARELRGQDVRIRFFMRSAHLYAIAAR